MATISANGGAERYWREVRGEHRLVLCRNGRLLLRSPGKRWQPTPLKVEQINPALWQADTGARASASVTRTQRMSRRGG